MFSDNLFYLSEFDDFYFWVFFFFLFLLFFFLYGSYNRACPIYLVFLSGRRPHPCASRSNLSLSALSRRNHIISAEIPDSMVPKLG